MAVSKKIRFEVFKRDSFTCQYCGRSAPDIVLNCDHIHPRAKGGKDEITNFVTSCFDCNQGKKDRTLDDDSVMQKRKRQLDLLQERREQLDMMMEWQRGLGELETNVVDELAKYWGELVIDFHLNDNGRADLEKLTRKFTVAEIAEAMRTAVSQYAEINQQDSDPPTHFTHESSNNAFNRVGGIAATNKRSKDKPYLRDMYYIRVILRDRLNYVDEGMVLGLLEEAILRGVDPDEIKRLARDFYVTSWTKFCRKLEEL